MICFNLAKIINWKSMIRSVSVEDRKFYKEKIHSSLHSLIDEDTS